MPLQFLAEADDVNTVPYLTSAESSSVETFARQSEAMPRRQPREVHSRARICVMSDASPGSLGGLRACMYARILRTWMSSCMHMSAHDPWLKARQLQAFEAGGCWAKSLAWASAQLPATVAGTLLL